MQGYEVNSKRFFVTHVQRRTNFQNGIFKMQIRRRIFSEIILRSFSIRCKQKKSYLSKNLDNLRNFTEIAARQ